MRGLRNILSKEKECTWEEEYRLKKANGEYLYVHDRGHIVYNEHHKATRIIGATQDINEKVLGKLELEKELFTKQKEITQAVLTAHENERASIGRKLHDNLCQVLIAARMHLETAKRVGYNKDVEIDKSVSLIAAVIEQMRDISKDLVIPPSHIITLFDNIRLLVKDIMTLHPIVFEFRNAGLNEKDLSENLQVNIFRIIQEQVNNILKHSEATRATIDISRYENEIILLISDNGKGTETLKEKKGVGIINIKSRVELLQGSVTITSSPSNGYQLKAVFPLMPNV